MVQIAEVDNLDYIPDNFYSHEPAITLPAKEFDIMLGMPCDGWDGSCDSMEAEHYRMNTMFPREESNWRYLCPDCQEACDAYWKERWDEYYSGCL